MQLGTQIVAAYVSRNSIPADSVPEVTAYGSLEADPSRSFTLRAPLAGRLAPPPGRAWPGIGATVADGQVVGQHKRTA